MTSAVNIKKNCNYQKKKKQTIINDPHKSKNNYFILSLNNN